MKIGAIILSRLDSERLPGKALLSVAGRPLIDYVMSFCRRIKGIDIIVLATSDRAVDNPLAEFAEQIGIPCARGALDDVAGRFLLVMDKFDLDGAVRVNGDSPLNDARLLSEGVHIFRKGNTDMVSNVTKRTYPYGMSMEIVGRKAMEYAYSKMNSDLHKEHVTKYLYDHKKQFQIHTITSGQPHFSGVQLAVDTQEDLDRFTWIINQLKCDPAEADINTIVNLAIRSPMSIGLKHSLN